MSISYPNGPKSGWLEQAAKIVSGEIELPPSDTPKLLNWLKDVNWPGAPQIALHLRSHDRTLARHIAPVLASGDLIWTHWVLDTFADSFDSEAWLPMKDALQKIAFQWDEEGAHIDSLYILARFRLADVDRIRAAIKTMKEIREADPDDYLKVESVLNDA